MKIRNPIRIVALSLLSTALFSILTGCGYTPSVEEDLANKTGKSLAEANQQMGLPAIQNFLERRLVKRLYELRDSTVVTNTYLFNSFNGDLKFLCKSIGYGIPYSVQFTNPEYVYNYYLTMPLPEPNTLYVPPSLAATWVLCQSYKTGYVLPVYSEPDIVSSPMPLKAAGSLEPDTSKATTEGIPIQDPPRPATPPSPPARKQ
jgi:hypothetical protein